MDDEQQPVLSGIRILDFTWVLAGPYATRLLADYGAEVIKVQPVTTPRQAEAFDTAYYEAWNRNKLGITLNMNEPEGLRLARRLVALSDVVIENFTPRVMENWGLDFPVLRQLKPDIIMVSMSAYGRSGPYRDRAGFAATVHASSGLTAMTAFKEDEPLGPGFSWADHVAGLYASIAILGALEKRDATGEGSFIDLSETRTVTGLLGGELAAYQLDGTMPPRGNRSGSAVQGVYPCLDGFCAVTVTDDNWTRFLQAMCNPDWGSAPRFATLTGRLEHQDDLDERISTWTREQSAEEVMSILQSKGIAAGMVLDAAGLASDPQLQSRGFFVEPLHSGRLVDANPIRFSDASPRYDLPAPGPGRDKAYVFGSLLGLDEADILRLQHDGII